MYRNMFYFLFDEEEYKAFIKNVEKQFRGSYEYTMWLNSKVDRESCGATGMTKDDDGIDIEVHHYGITLWGWIEKILDCFHTHEPELPVNTQYVCLILSDLHLSNCIPYVPLMHCIHRMIHNAGLDPVIDKYPSIPDNVYHGNIDLANEIIEYHIKRLNTILNEDN